MATPTKEGQKPKEHTEEDVMRRMLNTPHIPHKPKVTTKKKKTSK